MNRQFRITILVLTLVSLLSMTGCSLVGDPEDNKLTGNWIIPFFMDDFTDHENGWRLTIQPEGVIQYDGDALRMLIKKPGTELLSTPNLNIKNSTISVNTQVMGGPQNNLYGLVCGYKDNANYYSFLISSDGYYGIVKTIDGKRLMLGADSFTPSDLIQKGQGKNHLRADCIGKKLSFYVNWEKLAEVMDIDLSSGDVGLITGTMSEPGSDVIFDNFIVIDPDKQ